MKAALRDVTEFTVTVLDEMVEPEFPAAAILQILRPALDATVGAFQRTDTRTGATVNIADGCGPLVSQALAERSRTHWTEHPHMTAAARGDLRPATGQQAMGSERLWRRNAVRNFLVDIGGWDHIVSVPLVGGGGEVCGLSFGRAGRDFTPADVDLLTALQRPLQALERHARLMARWTDAFGVAPGAGAAEVRDAGLTARELDVLVLLADGHTATSIGRRLGCSPRTAHKHLEHVYRKLGVADRLGAVLAGQGRGLLPAGPATAPVIPRR